MPGYLSTSAIGDLSPASRHIYVDQDDDIPRKLFARQLQGGTESQSSSSRPKAEASVLEAPSAIGPCFGRCQIMPMCTYLLQIGLTALGCGLIYDAYRGYAHLLYL